MSQFKSLPIAAVVSAVLAAALAESVARAQERAAGADAPVQLQEVVVTGSRIKGNPDVLSSNPITVVGAAELQNSNSLDITNVLSKMSAVGSNGVNGAVSSNFGGNGFSFIDLRNLGAQRTLVLVDGQRFVSSVNTGAFSAVDFNNIPVEFIDHVEVLRDGASPIYGSDAVAGVINIITKQHFDGVQVNTQIGSTDKWDKQTYAASATMGSNFERGNFVLNFGYDRADPIFQRNRTWARNINGSANSAFWPDGRYVGTDSATGKPYDLVGDGHGGFKPTPGAGYDTTLIPNLFTKQVRKTFNGSGRYELNPDNKDFPVQLVGQFMYTDRESLGVANPDPQAVVVNSIYDTMNTNAGNIAGLPGPLTPDKPGTNTTSILYRSTALGNRNIVTDVATYRAVVGFQGSLFHKYDWEAKVIHGQSNGQGNTSSLVDQTNEATFKGDINNLQPGEITMLRDDTTDNLKTTEDIYEAQISGPAITLPAGDLSFAVGGDVRRESLTDKPDFANATGRTDQSGTPTAGGYNLKEGFVEFNIPVLKDQFLAKELSINTAGRFSHYSNFGTAKTWKVTVNWAPVEDVRLRSTLSTSFRAPTLQELFLANTIVFNGVNDPCDVFAGTPSLINTTTGAKHATVAANCAATLAKAQVQDPTKFVPSQNGTQQTPATSGGNSNLTPEQTHDLTVGVVLTPHWVPNLQVTVDYWRIRLSNQIIQAPDAQTYLDACYASVGLSDPSCATIGPRTDHPIPGQPYSGGISTQQQTSVNAGTIKTDGVDIGIDYSFALNEAVPAAGKLTFSDTGTRTLSFLAADQIGQINDFLGKIQQTSSTFTSANPKWANRATLTWSNDAFSFSWSARVIGHVKRYANANAPGADCGTPGDCLPNVWYNDISASYNWNKRYTLVAGVDNLLDQDPPFFRDTLGRTNSNPFAYDYVGRFMYLKATAKF